VKPLLLVLCLLLGAPFALADEAGKLQRKALRYLEPLPDAMPGAERDTPERIALGRKLFFDTRLSVNDRQSCASCHRLDGERAGVDNLPTSPGTAGQPGRRNSPTVLNAGWQFAQFWDGRAADLADQARQPILNPDEMAMPNEQAVVDKLAATSDYPALFAEAFPDAATPLDYANLAEAIAAFERTLHTPSRFDAFLEGDAGALDARELRGLDAFLSLGCTKCHDGPLLGGGLFERLEHYGQYPNQSDLGREEVTGDAADRLVFKVPQLRNVALTAPYYHDGAVESLDEAVRLMLTLVLDRPVKDAQVDDLVAFLGALTGRLPAGARP
jgi:cytochrome c peroxidase